MKFRDISERVKGGKLDPLSKMGKSKLTGQEIAKYYKDNPKAKQAARDKTVKKAIELALDLGGAQSYAIKEIEKLKRGLSKMPVVQQALRTANEEMTSTSSVAMPEIPLGRKHKVMKRKELEEGYGGGPKLSKAQIAKMKKVNYTPVDECSDEENFKPHKMYKGDKEVMANTYADHVKYDKMGYTHEKPKKESLDAKDKPFVKDLIKKLRGGSKTHAKQADDLEKAMKTENRAKRDAMRDMDSPKDKEDDGYGTATDDDRKAADKNVIMQIRRVADLPKGGQIELPSGKKVKMDRKSAIALNKKFDSIRKPQDKLKLQKMMNDKKISVVALKRLLGK